jgi:hypothetical protein
MFQAQFAATDDADWAVAVELTDDSTNLPFDTSTGVYSIEVSDCGTAVLSGDSTDGTITIPETGTVQWRFTAAQMAGLEVRKTYAVGLKLTNTDTSVIQLGIASLAVVDGGF